MTDVANYDRVPNGMRLLRLVADNLSLQSPKLITDGDLLVLREDKHPIHVGIMASRLYSGVEHPTLIHATSRLGKVVEEPLHGDLRRTIVRAYVLPGVT